MLPGDRSCIEMKVISMAKSLAAFRKYCYIGWSKRRYQIEEVGKGLSVVAVDFEKSGKGFR